MLLSASAVFADTFSLTTGGTVQGEWLNKDESPRKTFVVRQASGIVLKLEADQVREHRKELPAEKEYEKIAPIYPDTVQGQWALAEWCKEHHLTLQRKAHLFRILDLDPNHRQARALLGFAFVDGEWTTQQDARHAEGYEFYRGQWRTPQEIELLETRAKQELAEKAWLAKLVRLRSHFGTDKAEGAIAAIAAIKDNAAVRPLGVMLARERIRKIKMLYIDVLAGLKTGDAIGILVKTSLADPDEEIFYYCVGELVRLQPPHLADPYIKALGDANNLVVNRAAAALAQIGDTSAISPLIDALITTHQRVLRSKISPDATAATFGDNGTSFLQNDGPKIIVARVQNQHVLDALSKLTGTSFGFEQHAWRLWYDQERRTNAARDTAAGRRE